MAAPKEQRADYRLLAYFGILLVFGLVMLSSASSAVGQERFGDSYFFIKRQLLLGLLPGLVLFFFFAKLQFHKLRALSPVIYAGMIVSLLLVFIPGVGSTLNTAAQSWIVVGGLSVQPAEFAKLGLIIFLAAYLAKRGSELQDFQKGFLVSLLIAMVPVGLILLQPDVGTVIIIFAIIFAMFFAADTKLSHIVGLFAAGLAGLGVMVLIAPYRAARLTVFLHPELDPQGVGYQTTQALVAIGSGGLFGLGLGNSRQKFQYLPEVHADSIFAVIGEEMGFIISVAVIVLLLLIAHRALNTARHTTDMFARLTIVGILAWFMTQSFLNIGAAVGIMPLTGVPLPFVSHGGTALMMCMAAVGVLMSATRDTN